MSGNDWIKLTGYTVPYMAEILRGALEANGISAKVFNAHASSIMPHLSQMITEDVMVQKKELEQAQKLLQEFEAASLEENESEEESQ